MKFSAQSSAKSSFKSSIVDVNGISLHVVEQGEGKPVIFCHGFPDTWRGLRRPFEAVAAAGYRAIAFDMRGFGESSCPEDFTQYTPFHTVGDLVALADALKIETATLVGHDFGAITAWNAGMMRPDRFTAIYGISVPFNVRGNKSFLQELKDAGKTNFYMFFQMSDEAAQKWSNASKTIPGVLYSASAFSPPEKRWNPFDEKTLFPEVTPDLIPWVDAEDLRHTISAFEKTGFQTGLNYYRAIQTGFDLAAPFKGARIHQPCYFAVGKQEALQAFMHKSLDDFRKSMPGLRGYEIIENCGHWVAQEQPEVLSQSILKFLADLP